MSRADRLSGTDHYRAAEILLELAADEPEGSTFTAYFTAAAQAHATLALAAATALAPSGIPQDGNTAQDWRTAIASGASR